MPARIGVILVSWNSRHDVLTCLMHLRRQTYPAVRVLVVDNASTDGTAPAIIRNFPEVLLLPLDENCGFARAANLGIARALQDGAEYVLLLNADTTVEPTFVARMVEALGAHPQLGIISPKIYLATHPDQVWAVGGVMRPSGLHVYGIATVDGGQFDQVQLDFVFGCAMLIRTEVLQQIGMLDEGFFVFFEDIDLCIRARSAGWDIGVARDIRILHAGSGSTRNQPYLREFYLARSRAQFLSKYRRRFHLIPLVLSELRKLAQMLLAMVRTRSLVVGPAYVHGLLAGFWSGQTPPHARATRRSP